MFKLILDFGMNNELVEKFLFMVWYIFLALLLFGVALLVPPVSVAEDRVEGFELMDRLFKFKFELFGEFCCEKKSSTEELVVMSFGTDWFCCSGTDIVGFC